MFMDICHSGMCQNLGIRASKNARAIKGWEGEFPKRKTNKKWHPKSFMKRGNMSHTLERIKITKVFFYFYFTTKKLSLNWHILCEEGSKDR